MMPVVADVTEIHGSLAQIAARHFRDYSLKESDTLAAFMCVVKAKGKHSSLIPIFCIAIFVLAICLVDAADDTTSRSY